MSNTIMVIDNKVLGKLYALNLKLYVGSDVIPKQNHNEVIGLLEHLPTIDLIVTDESVDEQPTRKLIIDYLKAKNLEIPVIVLGDGQLPPERCKLLPPNVEIKTLIKAAAEILSINAREMAEQIVPDYYPIAIEYFMEMNLACCEVYFRSRQDDCCYQYTKLFDPTKAIDNSTVLNLQKHGTKELYIPAPMRLKFVNSFTEQITEKLNRNDLSQAERTRTTGNAMLIVQNRLKDFNLDEDTVKMVNSSVGSLLKVVKDAPVLSDLLKDLMNKKNTYLYQHTQLITYVSCHIIQFMDWGSSEQQEKLSFVAFFHDIVLQTDEQAKIYSDEQLTASPLTTEEKNLVTRHAYMAADLISQYPNAPFGADTIIKEHHGSRNGFGLSSNYAANISPLAIIFIIAEEFSHRLISNPDEDHKLIIAGLEKKYNGKDKYMNAISTLKYLNNQNGHKHHAVWTKRKVA